MCSKFDPCLKGRDNCEAYSIRNMCNECLIAELQRMALGISIMMHLHLRVLKRFEEFDVRSRSLVVWLHFPTHGVKDRRLLEEYIQGFLGNYTSFATCKCSRAISLFSVVAPCLCRKFITS